MTDVMRRAMRANKINDIKPELTLRYMLHRDGHRFRIHGRQLPKTPDVMFTARRKVVGVLGCFWQPHPGC